MSSDQAVPELFCGECGRRVQLGVLMCPTCGSEDLLPARRARLTLDDASQVDSKSVAPPHRSLDRDQWVALKFITLLIGWVLVAAFLAFPQGRRALALSVVILVAVPVVFLAILGYYNTHPNRNTASPIQVWWSVLVGPVSPIFGVLGSIFAVLAIGLGVVVALLSILAAAMIIFLFTVCAITV